jgi:NAD(P)-dependent dehydrogenase (short-subunit alcohol dehydrogenase family)
MGTSNIADKVVVITGASSAVAPGVVDTPLHDGVPKESLTTRQPLKTITEVKDIVDAVLYLTRAGQVTGEVIHVDGGSHAGCW